MQAEFAPAADRSETGEVRFFRDPEGKAFRSSLRKPAFPAFRRSSLRRKTERDPAEFAPAGHPGNLEGASAPEGDPKGNRPRPKGPGRNPIRERRRALTGKAHRPRTVGAGSDVSPHWRFGGCARCRSPRSFPGRPFGIPAKAGIQSDPERLLRAKNRFWTPAFTGMTTSARPIRRALAGGGPRPRRRLQAACAARTPPQARRTSLSQARGALPKWRRKAWHSETESE